MNLMYFEKMNQLTETIIETRQEIEARKKRPPHQRVGYWRHQYNIDLLKARAEHLERKRLAMLHRFRVVLRSPQK
jgi:hypothetical protein